MAVESEGSDCGSELKFLTFLLSELGWSCTDVLLPHPDWLSERGEHPRTGWSPETAITELLNTSGASWGRATKRADSLSSEVFEAEARDTNICWITEITRLKKCALANKIINSFILKCPIQKRAFERTADDAYGIYLIILEITAYKWTDGKKIR